MTAHIYLKSISALMKKQEMDLAYRVYVTDCLRLISENTAKQVGGSFVDKRFADMLKPNKNENAKEIIDRITENCGLEVIE